jgi:hypothetical protein
MKTITPWCVCVALVLIGMTQSVQAQEAQPEAPAPSQSATEVTTLDYILMPAAGAVGGSALGLLTGFIAEGECGDDDWDTFCTARFVFGFSGGYPVGMLSSMYLYGELRGLEGSGTGLLLGSLAGFAGSGLLALGLHYTAGEDARNLSALSVLVLPTVGGTLGYMMGRPDDLNGQTHGNLLNYDPDTGLRVEAPGVVVSTAQDDTRVSVPLLGGTF